MLVYGDHWRSFRPQERLAELARVVEGPADASSRQRLTRALIAAGELAQALADADFEALGLDHVTERQAAAMALCTALASRLFNGHVDARSELAALARHPMPAVLKAKIAEGYAFYAVLPEAYAAAARAHPWTGPPLVLGLRSIGLGLAAVVAAVTGGYALSLRPCGHPFDRRISASEDLKAQLSAHVGPFAIVDEGPGLSGSSFGAVADLLESLGVAPERIVSIPSHGGSPGAQALPRHRARWAVATRVHRTLDDLLADDPIAAWFEDLTGPMLALEDLSGGAWRKDLPQTAWPPAYASQERRKFRLTAAQGRFVARFAGLSDVGEEKFQRAKVLADAGFTPEPLALRRGFLLERWIDGAPLASTPASSLAIATRLPAYLGFRAREFPARRSGASADALQEMAVHNARELCGQDIARRVQERLEQAFGRISDLRPVHVDARLQPWEWRLAEGGRLWKTDALDHAEAHDLIGAQDIAWDVAGAAVEHGLAPEHLTKAVSDAAGAAIDPMAVEAYGICYAAFQGGLWSFAEGQADADEAVRIRRHRRRYIDHLHAAAGDRRLLQDTAERGLHV